MESSKIQLQSLTLVCIKTIFTISITCVTSNQRSIHQRLKKKQVTKLEENMETSFLLSKYPINFQERVCSIYLNSASFLRILSKFFWICGEYYFAELLSMAVSTISLHNRLICCGACKLILQYIPANFILL